MSLPSDTLVSVELVILILMDIFFTMLYEMNGRMIWSGIIAGVVWFITSLYYFVVFANNASGVISLFFSALGIIYTMRWFADLLSMRGLSRKMEDDID